ncbi:MAG: RsmD family RNA methyltransferase [Candidatus Bruticola sp.]
MKPNPRLPSRTWMRPTTNKTREALTATLRPYLDSSSRVLDLFAGTGSLGLALWHEGCAEVTFVEGDKRSLKFLHEAVGTVGRIVFGQLPKALECLSGQQFDIIVADPPYNSEDGPQTLLSLDKYTSPGGIVVFEYHHKENYPREFANFTLVKTKRFGETALTFWQKKDTTILPQDAPTS